MESLKELILKTIRKTILSLEDENMNIWTLEGIEKLLEDCYNKMTELASSRGLSVVAHDIIWNGIFQGETKDHEINPLELWNKSATNVGHLDKIKAELYRLLDDPKMDDLSTVISDEALRVVNDNQVMQKMAQFISIAEENSGNPVVAWHDPEVVKNFNMKFKELLLVVADRLNTMKE